jgi:hypothetical protein
MRADAAAPLHEARSLLHGVPFRFTGLEPRGGLHNGEATWRRIHQTRRAAREQTPLRLNRNGRRFFDSEDSPRELLLSAPYR